MAKRAASLALAAGVAGQATITTSDTFGKSPSYAQDPEVTTLEIVNRAAVETWCTVDGTAPAAGADESYWLPPNVGAKVTVKAPPGPVTVRALAAAAGAITVQHVGA